ncbi:MAG: LamG domain-containing protein [Oligoflexia bacterium]|nr:LamG domain-containing protein [Oligoflexia bacterium]
MTITTIVLLTIISTLSGCIQKDITSFISDMNAEFAGKSNPQSSQKYLLANSSTTVNFGFTPVSKNSPSQTITFRNTGSDFTTSCNPIAITTITAGTTPSEFVVSNSNCNTSTLYAPGDSCQVSVYASPGTAGSKSAILSLTCNGTTSSVALTATATTISSLKINDGATSTTSRNVLLSYTLAGESPRICFSESSSSGNCSWFSASARGSNIPFELSSGDGSKRIYAWITDNSTTIVSQATTASINLDSAGPKVSFSSGSGSYSKAASFSINILFDEKVYNFNDGEYTLYNATPATGTLTTIIPNISYQFSAYPGVEGTVAARLPAAAVSDINGQPNDQSEVNHVLTYDVSGPLPTINSTPYVPFGGGNVGLSGSPTFTMLFALNESVTPASSSFATTHLSCSNCSISSVGQSSGGGGNNYYAIIAPTANLAASVQLLAASFYDRAGNPNVLPSPLAFTLDKTNPTPMVTVTYNEGTPLATGAMTNLSGSPTFSVRFAFAESVTPYVTFDSSMVAATSAAVVGATPASFTAILAPTATGSISGNNISFRLKSSAVKDLGGNLNTSSEYFTLIYDNLAPIPTISASGPTGEALTRGALTNLNSGHSYGLQLHFSEAVTPAATFNSTRFTLNAVLVTPVAPAGGADFYATAAATAEASPTFTLKAGSFRDAAGNLNAASTPFGIFLHHQTPIPQVTAFYGSLVSNALTSGAISALGCGTPITLRYIFSDSQGVFPCGNSSGSCNGSFSATCSNCSATVNYIQSLPDRYEVIVVPTPGAISVQLNANTARDGANNRTSIPPFTLSYVPYPTVVANVGNTLYPSPAIQGTAITITLGVQSIHAYTTSLSCSAESVDLAAADENYLAPGSNCEELDSLMVTPILSATPTPHTPLYVASKARFLANLIPTPTAIWQWAPTQNQRGTYKLNFTASNSCGRSSTTSIYVSTREPYSTTDLIFAIDANFSHNTNLSPHLDGQASDNTNSNWGELSGSSTLDEIVFGSSFSPSPWRGNGSYSIPYALTFSSGANDYLDVGGSIDPGTKRMAMMVWYRQNSYGDGGNRNCLFDTRDNDAPGAGNAGWGLCFTNGDLLEIVMQEDAANYHLRGHNSKLNLSEWNMLGFSWDQPGDSLPLYQNGVTIAGSNNDAGAVPNVTSAQNLRIGLNSNDSNFSGDLALALIYQKNGALTATHRGTFLATANRFRINRYENFIQDSSLLYLFDAGNAKNGFAFPGVAFNDCSNLLTSPTELSPVAAPITSTLNNFDTCSTYGWQGAGSASNPYLLKFDGIDSYVDTNDGVRTLNTLTVSAWVKSSGNTNKCFFSWSEAADSDYVTLCQVGAPAKFVATINSSAATQTVTSITSATSGYWNFVTLTWDGASMKLIVNGDLEATAALIGDATNIQFPELGRDFDTTNPFDGGLALVAIYNRTLTANEVMQNFLATANRFRAGHTVEKARNDDLVLHIDPANAEEKLRFPSTNDCNTDQSLANISPYALNDPEAFYTRPTPFASYGAGQDCWQGAGTQATPYHLKTVNNSNSVIVPINDELDNTPTSGTYAFWMNGNAAGLDNCPLFTRLDRSAAGQEGIEIVQHPGAGGTITASAFGSIAGTSSFSMTSTQGAGNPNYWYHVALTYSRANGGTNRLYINATPEAVSTSSAAWNFRATSAYRIGANESVNGCGANAFGVIRVYKSALNAQEVQALYKAECPRYYATPCP